MTEQPLRIFVAYGHDAYADLARRLRSDLWDLGHEVWFDEDELTPGRDWQRVNEEGLEWVAKDRSTWRFVLLMSR